MTSLIRTRSAMSPQRMTLQLEGAGIAALCVLLYAQAGGGWWLFALLILAPDLAMAGFLLGPRAGALCYNIAHSYLAPLALSVVAHLAGWEGSIAIALIWGAHIGADRAVGYGLKYASGFRDTHLGRV